MNTRNITLTLSGARPNNLPDMVLDEIRTINVKCGPVAGSNTVSAVSITGEPSGLTIGSATVSSPNATVNITAANEGCYTLTASATLSSGEIYKGIVSLKVVDPDADASDYQG